MKNIFSSRLRVLTCAALLAAAGFASCSDDKEGGDPTPPTPPTPPAPVELNDQIEYDGGKLIDIKSSIYDVEDTDLYTFYLSPTEGIVDVEGMTAANDFLRVVVRNPKGTVNTAADEFEIAYRDIDVVKQTLGDTKTIKLSADLVAETSKLNLYVEVELKSGKTLLARYNNTCAAVAPKELTNQWELNRKITDIGSIVEWLDPAAKTTTWYFYADKDVTAPSADKNEGMRITVAEGAATAEVDLSTADAEKLAIVCGDFTNAAGTTGTLNLVKNEDGTLTLAINAANGADRLRAAYGGAFATGFKSANRFSVSGIETPAQTDLKRIFLFKDTSRSNYAFGLADAEAPAALMDGKYALRLGIGNAVFGRTIDLATQASMCELEVYEYDTYTTYDVNQIEGVTGTVISAGTAERPYLYVKAVFPDGPTVEGEWFGDATALTEAFDIVPVKPFVPYIKIFSKDGDVIFEKTLGRMEMRMEKDYRLRGGNPQFGGAIIDAYFFYFRPVEDTGNIDDTYGDYSYPILMMAKPYIGSTDLNLADPKEDLHWNFKYTANDNKLQYGSSGYSETYSTGYSTSGYCPDEVKTTIVQNEDKTWTVTIQLKDAGSSLNYAGQPQPWGYGNSIVVEWKGAATKYTGTKKNDLTDADY